MVRTQWKGGRGGHRGSSQPNSPANLNSLGRIPREGEPSSIVKPKRPSPKSKSFSTSSYSSNVPEFTPDRRRPLMEDDVPGDGSPLPRHRRPVTASFGLSDHAPGSPPTLSSSYLQEDAGSMVTPAPSRVHPRLAPPSTAQRPSQHMPTSSPAPFWKYADYGTTPMRLPAFDTSPIKRGRSTLMPPSSSPPQPHRASAITPTRTAVIPKIEPPTIEEPDDEEEGGFDLTRYVYLKTPSRPLMLTFSYLQRFPKYQFLPRCRSYWKWHPCYTFSQRSTLTSVVLPVSRCRIVTR
jgi:hypothetical protein